MIHSANKNKSPKNSSLDEKCADKPCITYETNIKITKLGSKISDDNIVFPTIQNYEETMKHNYNLTQLKTFAKHYKLKIFVKH
jgi:hypothetical protein